MKLLPLDTPERLVLAAGWLARRENAQWLDFGNGMREVTPMLLKIMAQRESHLLRVYTAGDDDDGRPIGIVGLNAVEPAFGTATLWGVSGDKSFLSRGYAVLGSSKLLTLGFRELGLRSINTWVVDRNPSLRSVERLGFRYVGRLRRAHRIDGEACDRLLFDLLAEEHRELDERRLDRSIAARGGRRSQGAGEVDTAATERSAGARRSAAAAAQGG